MGHIKIIRITAPLLLAGAVLGCSAPPLKEPAIAIPEHFKEAGAEDAVGWTTARPAQAQDRGQWWKAFGDTTLDGLIEDATVANPGLAMAAARVKQARSVAGIVAADQIPAVNGQLGARRGGEVAAQRGPKLTLLQAGLSASYEADLFGRVAAASSAARADASASEGLYRSVLLALQSDVAQSYLRLRALDAELQVLHKIVHLREETALLAKIKREHGDVGDLDVARTDSELSAARAEMHAVRGQRARLEHALAVLLGRPVSAFSFASAPLPQGFLLPSIPAGVPSTLLERRPDISAAQLAMVAANARIGVARAARFPSVLLSADVGHASSELGQVFTAASRTWALGAVASLPLLDGGRGHAEVTRSRAAFDEAAASYRQTVLVAFAEVEDDLVGVRALSNQATELDLALAAARRAASIADAAYRAGAGSYLELLDAQRSLASVERSAVHLNGERAVATVALIRALGGAW